MSVIKIPNPCKPKPLDANCFAKRIVGVTVHLAIGCQAHDLPFFAMVRIESTGHTQASVKKAEAIRASLHSRETSDLAAVVLVITSAGGLAKPIHNGANRFGEWTAKTCRRRVRQMVIVMTNEDLPPDGPRALCDLPQSPRTVVFLKMPRVRRSLVPEAIAYSLPRESQTALLCS